MQHYATRQTILSALEGALPASIPIEDGDSVVIPIALVQDAIELIREGV